jgi:hypothetical protein
MHYQKKGAMKVKLKTILPLLEEKDEDRVETI